MTYTAKRIAGGILVGTGVAIALALTGLMAWAAFEGLSYFSSGAGYEAYGGLHCPILISSAETGVVQAAFDNPTDQVQEPYYQVEISAKAESRKLENQISVPAHSSRVASWTVSADDIDLEPFIFVKMDVLPMDTYATREATCGILVAGLGGLKGSIALAIAMAIGLGIMLAGLVLPALGLNPSEAVQFDVEAGTNRRRTAQALGVASTAGVLAAVMGWWLIALLLLAVSLLLGLMTITATISGNPTA